METVETISGMSAVVYVLADPAGEPPMCTGRRTRPTSLYTAASGAHGAIRRRRGARFRAFALEDLQEMLRGPWSHVKHVIYFPSVSGFLLSRERIFELETETA